MKKLFGKPIAKFCQPDSPLCPELFVNDKAETNKRIIITDDFGSKVEMSKEQFNAFVKMAKENQLDVK